MASPTPQAFVIKLTHTGVYADGRPNVSSVQINDLDTGLEQQNRKVIVYVPPNGTIEIPASSRSLLSYSNGTIRRFVEVGVLTAEFCFQFRDYNDYGGPLGTGINLFPGIPDIERSSNLLSFLIAAGIDTSGFIVGEKINISGLSGGFAGLDGAFIIKTIEKAVDLFGFNLLTYKITVESIGPNIAPAILPGVLLTLPSGKATFVISTVGDVGGFGSQFVQYIGGGLSVSGPIDPTLIQLTPISTLSVPKSSIFVSITDFLPYFKDEFGVDQPLIGGGGGGVPPTRTLTAGDGLTGGGNLTVDRTFNVGTNPDGSILINPDDIQIGILATDVQHGLRGGGTQHSIATPILAGFMSAADKIKLDSVTPADYLTAITHKTLRQLIHLADNDGPMDGFVSGLFEEILPIGDAFPTSIIWWESAAKIKKIVENGVAYNIDKTISTDAYSVYDTDGVTVLLTMTDSYDYSGGKFLTPSRTRTLV